MRSSSLVWRLAFAWLYPFVLKQLPRGQRSHAVAAEHTATALARAFGGPPVDMRMREDGYWFAIVPMALSGAILVLTLLVGLLCIVTPSGHLEQGAAGTVLMSIIQAFLILTMYGAFLMMQVTGCRRLLCRRDHAQWVRAGRPDAWVPSARSQPRDLDFLYALIPTALMCLLLVQASGT